MMIRVVYDPSSETKGGAFMGRVENAETGEIVRGVRGIKWESAKPGDLPILTLEFVKDYLIDVRAEWPRRAAPGPYPSTAAAETGGAR